MSEIVQTINPERMAEKNDYQYFKRRIDGWTFSVVCNRGTHGQDLGLFEIGVWDSSNPEHIVIIVQTHCDFKQVVKFEKQFDEDPRKLARKASGFGEPY
jgi:hypothetical protein